MSCSVALDNTGIVYTWGAWGVGNGAGASPTAGTPVAITGGSLAGKKVVAIASGDSYALALDSTGVIHGWGYNAFGQLGDGTTTNRSTPVPITAGSLATVKIVYIGANNKNSFAIDTDGRIHAWGAGGTFQLGNGGSSQVATPFRPTTGSLLGKRFTKILPYASNGYNTSNTPNTTIALDTTGRVHNWGESDSGLNYAVLGQASDIQFPTIYASGIGVIDIAAGVGHACCMNNQGEILMWGANYNGQIGIGNKSNNDGFNHRTSVYGLAANQGLGQLNTSGPFFVNFTGQHRCFVNGIEQFNIHDYEGLIVVSDQNQYASMNAKNNITINESLPLVSVSKNASDKRSFGVISLVSDAVHIDETTATQLKERGDLRLEINSVGEGAIWVSDIGGALEAGDYITTSSVLGYGMKQNDDILRNYTVAKITMDCDFSQPSVIEETIKKDEYGNNVLDQYGYPIWEPVTTTITTQDTNGNTITTTQPVTKPLYKIRYIDEYGNKLTESEYTLRKAGGELVYKAAFVGCTYHCG